MKLESARQHFNCFLIAKFREMTSLMTILCEKHLKLKSLQERWGQKIRHKPQKCGNPTKTPVEFGRKTKVRVPT